MMNSDLKLDVKNWKSFRVGDLFDVKLSKGDLKLDELDKGDIKLISAISDNNGIIGFIDNKGDGKVEIFNGNSITIDMFCNVFYQDKNFYSVSHGRVNILIPKFNSNKFIGLFFTILLQKELYRFNYGRAVYSKEAENLIIKLPTTPQGEPDFEFMERYIKKIYDKLEKKIITKNKNKNKIELKTEEWKEFKITDLFDIEKGREIISDTEERDIPLISATENNNGIAKFIKNGIKLFEKNKITLASNGSVGETFFQNKNFYATTDISILTSKFNISKYVYLYLVFILKNEKYKFSYGRKWGIDRLEKTIIKLPTTPQGEPDFEFMENYIKSLPYGDLI